jgi:hypothetical protein
MDRPDPQLSQVACVSDLSRCLPDAIAQFECRLLGESADDDLSRLCLLEEKEVQRAEDE